MPLQKNQILTLRIERLSSDGSGVAHSPDGETVFVPGAAPGDEADVRIVKDCKRYAFGILDHLRTPSPDRIPVDCTVAGPCGGCSLRHLDYTAELRAKQENVTDAFRRIGGLDVPVLDICPSPEVDRYRNKVQFPVGLDKNGNPCIGFYAGRTHRIVPCPDCKLQPGVLNDIGNALCRFFAENGIQPYNEETGRGLVRHIFLRRGAHSGQIMVCLVCTRPNLPHADALCTRLREQFAERGLTRFLPNMDAVLCRIDLHTGDLDSADEWYRAKAPRDPMHLNVMKRYQYFTQAMVEIADGKPDTALMTLSPLEPYIKSCARNIDGIHLNVLIAIILYGKKDPAWKQRLTDALNAAEEYRFIRTISIYGTAVLPLLDALEWTGNEKWYKRLMADVRAQAAYYPRFLQTRLAPNDTLTPTELQILHLICADKSNAEIAQIMDIKLPTVKTHVSHILNKLDVSRRSEAKTVAKKLRLISGDL